jgi:hypothetical protein
MAPFSSQIINHGLHNIQEKRISTFVHFFSVKFNNLSFQNIRDTTERKDTGLFISPSGTSELSCTTTKTDTAERNIPIGAESLQVFFVYEVPLRTCKFYIISILNGFNKN